MLFLLGHGVVVGNDIFLLDENASEQSLTLTNLGQILAEFKHSIELEGKTPEETPTLELVSFHSCSVSSLEVAYELQGTAKYMLALPPDPGSYIQLPAGQKRHKRLVA
jgi:hypothetical protein